MTDIELIKTALSTLYRLTEGMKYGGLLREYELAKRALEAIQRIETPPLPGMADWPVEAEVPSPDGVLQEDWPAV
jgi:hypothetical protein